MVHKWLGDLFDTLVYLVVLMVLLFFFFFYWNGEYQIRHAEGMLQEFLDGVSAKGKISLTEYENLVKRLNELNPSFEIEITCIQYCWQPVYDLISKEKLNQYYMSRNVREKTVLQNYEVEIIQENADALCMQAETNESIMAAENGEYLSLPDDDAAFTIEAVRPYQEVYTGEKLITLCRVASQEGVYYAEADDVVASVSGEIALELTLGKENFRVPVLVQCYPRYVVCEYGHNVVNSREVLEETKQTGDIKCPYCKELPENVTCNAAVLCKKTGTELTKSEVWLTVQFKDGHTEYVTPESDEWQDTYDENYCGIQQVTIRYRGAEDTLSIVSENEKCEKCAQECNERCFADYMIFPYCIECMAQVSLFTGETYEEEQLVVSDKIIAVLDTAGEFCMKSGDLITLYLSKGGIFETMLQREVKKKESPGG